MTTGKDGHMVVWHARTRCLVLDRGKAKLHTAERSEAAAHGHGSSIRGHGGCAAARGSAWKGVVGRNGSCGHSRYCRASAWQCGATVGAHPKGGEARKARLR